MYFLLDVDSTVNNNPQKERGQNSHVSLILGESLDAEKDDLELPYRFEMSVDEGEEPVIHAWYPGSNIMQQSMVDALHAAGVDNLQVFPAEVKREGSGDDVPGFVVVNIVGAVACADMSKSNAQPLADVSYFRDLVIDAKKTRDLLLFRVAESSMLVLVHEKVATQLKAATLAGLTLTPVKESTD